MDGNDECSRKHIYPSAKSVQWAEECLRCDRQDHPGGRCKDWNPESVCSNKKVSRSFRRMEDMNLIWIVTPEKVDKILDIIEHLMDEENPVWFDNYSSGIVESMLDILEVSDGQ